MNVIMVCESAQLSGGAEKIAIQETRELRRRGYRVGYIAANDSADPELVSSGAEILLTDTKSFFDETVRKLKLQKLLANKEIETKIEDFLSSFEPRDTVIHLHTFRLRLSGIVPHVAQELGFKTIIHCHDYSPVCPTSLLFDHRSGTNCHRKPMSLSCISCECQNQRWKYKLPKLTSYFWNQAVWKVNQRASGIIHISELERRTSIEAGCPATSSFSVLPITSFLSSPRIKSENNRNFVFVGRLTHEKGVDVFLDSAVRASVSAVVIGDGPLRESLQTAYPTARFTGWIDEDEIGREFGQARALVVPSRWRETLCLSVIDAMHLGVPCIVSNNVGAKEYIDDGINGEIFSEGSLTESLTSFSDDSHVKGLSENAYATFQNSPMTIARHVDALIPIYEQCLGGGVS